MTVDTLRKMLNGMPGDVKITVRVAGCDNLDLQAVECRQFHTDDPFEVILRTDL